MLFYILLTLSVFLTVLGSAAPLSPSFGVVEGEEQMYMQSVLKRNNIQL